MADDTRLTLDELVDAGDFMREMLRLYDDDDCDEGCEYEIIIRRMGRARLETLVNSVRDYYFDRLRESVR